MVNDRDAYLKHAGEAEDQAAAATSPAIKARFLELAEEWRRLAASSSGRWAPPPPSEDEPG
jgi:hypothetical protein